MRTKTIKAGSRTHPGSLIAQIAERYAAGISMSSDAIEHDREVVNEGGLKAFVKLAWPLIDPAPFVDNWHIGAICEHLDAMLVGDIKRLIINVPPGTSKTSITSVLWPAHVWTVDPVHAFITASYSSKLSTRDARRMREVTHSKWYRDRWPRGGVEDLSKIVHFENSSGGWRLSTTPGADATGFHADTQIVDDPLKPRDARDAKASDVRARLEEINDWWGQTMSTRAKVLEMLRRLIIMQRLHDRDLSGAMLAEGGWEHLCLPMEYNPKIMCETSLGSPDPRTEPGELLNPARFSKASVDALRRDLGSAAAAQLDQSPVTPGGGLFKESYFAKRWSPSTLPGDLIIVQSWDLRFKDDAEKGSFVTGGVWGYTPGASRYYLLDQVRGRWSYAQTKDEFRTLANAWPRTTAHLIENKANGPALASDLEKEGYNIILLDPLGSKIVRAHIAEPHYRAGCVYLPPCVDGVEAFEWVPEFIKEHVRFPRYKTDDQVDQASQAITWMHVEGSVIGDYLAGIRAAAGGKR